jgi:asparagine synthase (glutamine-hydrolysing)
VIGFFLFFSRDAPSVGGARHSRRPLRHREAPTERWTHGPVFLEYATDGPTHSFAKLSRESQSDSASWIVGDIRLDDTRSLRNALAGRGEASAAKTSDAELALAAYDLWGESCVDRLRGDFAFAIWDAARSRIFCARDHFGVRQLYFSDSREGFVCSNTIQALRATSTADLSPDPYYLADFLSLGFSADRTATIFRDIRALAPAHCLSVDADRLATRPYWTLPLQPEIHVGSSLEYVEQFVDALTVAVRDRIQGPVALGHSGGLDSNAIASILFSKLGGCPAHPGVAGFCAGWNAAFTDPEPSAARLAAEALGLQTTVLEAPDDIPIDWDSPDLYAPPQPVPDPYFHNLRRLMRRYREHAPVLLNGQGGDEVLMWDPIILALVNEPLWRVVSGVAATVRIAGTLPPTGLRTALAELRDPNRSYWRVPKWVDAEWAGQHGLKSRYRDLEQKERATIPQGRRIMARRRLSQPLWPWYLEQNSPATLGVDVETRWPFLDLRVIAAGLGLPNFPWCSRKLVLREALRPVLPLAIVDRPKMPLMGDPLTSFVRRQRPDFQVSTSWSHAWLAPYMDVARWKSEWSAAIGAADDAHAIWALYRPLALAAWLRANANVNTG